MNGDLDYTAHCCFFAALSAINHPIYHSAGLVTSAFLDGLKYLVEDASKKSLPNPERWLRDNSESFLKTLSAISVELMKYRQSFIEDCDKFDRECKNANARKGV